MCYKNIFFTHVEKENMMMQKSSVFVNHAKVTGRMRSRSVKLGKQGEGILWRKQ